MNKQLALSKCMQLCSMREYCIFDIEQKLQKWELSQKDVSIIIDSLIDQKFIDHARYVPAFINDKLKFNHWGKIKIKYHLKQKQIDSYTINEYIEKIDATQYSDIIKQEIKNKLPLTKANSSFEIKQKVARYVISKGFEPALVFELLKLE